MRTWTIGRRMVVGFSVLTFVSVIVGAVAYTGVVRINTESDVLADDVVPGLKTIAHINGSVQESRAVLLRHMLSEDPAAMAALERELDGLTTSISTEYDTYEKALFQDEDRRLFATLQKERVEFRRVRDDVVLPLS